MNKFLSNYKYSVEIAKILEEKYSPEIKKFLEKYNDETKKIVEPLIEDFIAFELNLHFIGYHPITFYMVCVVYFKPKVGMYGLGTPDFCSDKIVLSSLWQSKITDFDKDFMRIKLDTEKK